MALGEKRKEGKKEGRRKGGRERGREEERSKVQIVKVEAVNPGVAVRGPWASVCIFLKGSGGVWLVWKVLHFYCPLLKNHTMNTFRVNREISESHVICD